VYQKTGPPAGSFGVEFRANFRAAQLTFASIPENEAELRELAAGLDSSSSMPLKTRICAEGFAEVQLLVRDPQLNQVLVSKFATNPVVAFKYAE
jgi:hypothetical protein